MDLQNIPSGKSAKRASDYIKLLDSTKGAIANSSVMLSKVTKNLKTVKAPVIRYFEAPGTISTYFSEGEYDLVSVFKLAKYESFFLKASQKKLALLTKSGFSFVADNDEVTKYINSRFLAMQLSTGVSKETIIKTLAWYLIICSNAFLIKVRDKNFEYASSYVKNGKEMHPVVGYFLAHPTTVKPKFKYVKDTFNGQVLWKWEIDKWVQTNRKGQIRMFDPEDVIHFTLLKEDGMILGMPEVIPVIDDIRTLRKIEEDIQLLIHRDLFPIVHYKVEKPQMVDHGSQSSELDQAKKDMQFIIQDGGIATDARHTIEFIGNNGKSIDVTPFLEHFKQRVWTGLGVSALDMSVADAGNLGSAQEASKTLMDSVKFIQQELSRQIQENILIELLLQSPYANNIGEDEYMPRLSFEEVDTEWKIRQENHEADLFAKGTKTIHEVRNKRGEKTLSDEDLMYTHPALFSNQIPHKTALDTQYGDKVAAHEGKIAHATAVETVTKTSQPGAPTKKTHTKPVTGGKSAANNDPIKTSKSNSNIVKKKAHDFLLEDSLGENNIREQFIDSISKLQDSNANKINLIFAIKNIYDDIKTQAKESIKLGIEDASKDLEVEELDIRVEENIFKNLDSIRDDISDKLYKDPSYINKAANRVAMAYRTEKVRGYNYGVYLAAKSAGRDKLVIYSGVNELSDDSMELLGKEIDIANGISELPPFRANQTGLLVRAV